MRIGLNFKPSSSLRCLDLIFILLVATLFAACGKSSKPAVEKPIETVGLEKDEELVTDFSLADLHATELKVFKRFERLALEKSQIQSVKTWKTQTYIWTKLNYLIVGDPEGRFIYLACHYHGSDLGCHTKQETGPEEPAEDLNTETVANDFPSMDDL